jgi:serine/threonine protein phosphatase 1
MTRLIAIGDIHGEIEKLNSLLDKLNLTKSDTVVFLGDYIDRGNNPKEVITRLIELSKETNCIFLKGNHEDMLLNILKTKKEEDIEHWLLAGGVTTYDNYGGFPEIFDKHREFFENLKPYYMTEKYIFVHAGVNPDNATIEEQTSDDLFWIRTEFLNKPHKFRQKVIFGHTPFKEPLTETDKIGIDTGCGKGAELPLTALICDNETFIRSN